MHAYSSFFSSPHLGLPVTSLPRMIPVRQHFASPELPDAVASLAGELAGLGLPDDLRQMRVAVAVGSRGISDLSALVRELVGFLCARNARPFIVPAMGSHGQATAEGQAAVLAGYGITREQTGAEVVSSMRTVVAGYTRQGLPVYCDAEAWEADAIVPINRIKPHTQFRAPIESGLLKMIAVGLGKDKGAAAIHGHGISGLVSLIPEFADIVLRSGKVLFGVGVVENARHKAARIKALLPGEMAEEEAKLLLEARDLMPGLPVDACDLLLLDRMGKDISGPGMDSAVTGRIMANGVPDPSTPRVKLLAALDLTEASHGNAVGVGLADLISRRLADKIDLHATYINTIIGGFPVQGKIPMVMPNDRVLLDAANLLCGVPSLDKARVIHADSTLNLERLLVSEALLPELEALEHVEILGSAVKPAFDADNNLIPVRKI